MPFVIAPLGTVLVNVIEGDDFTLEPVHVMVLIVGLLGLWHLLASADVLARAMAAGSEAEAKAMAQRRDAENLIPFALPLRWDSEGRE